MSKVQSIITGAGILVLLIASSVLSSPPAQATTCYAVVNNIIVGGSGCSGNLIIDNSVTGIGQDSNQYGAFEGVGTLRNVVIPGSVTHVDYGAFRSSGIESIRFEAGSSPLTINAHAIDFTSYLKSVVFSPNTVSIGEYAFYTTPLLRKVFIPASVTSIHHTAFGHSGLTDLIIEGGARQIFTQNLANMWNPVVAWVSAQDLSAFQSLNAVSGVTFQAGNGPAPTISYPESNTVINTRAGEAYSLTMSYFASGNSSTSVSAGTLPPGLQLDLFGHLTGTPTAAGTYSFSLMVTDTFSATVQAANISMNVAAAFNGTVELSTSAAEISWEDQSTNAYITTNAPSVYPMAEFLSDAACFQGSNEFFKISNDNNTVASGYYLNNPINSQLSCAGTATLILRIYSLGTQNIDFNTSYLASITVRIVTTSTQPPVSPSAYQIAQEREAKEAKARLLLLENLAQGKTLTLSALISAGISITSEATAERVSNDLLAKRLQSPEKKLDMSAVQSSVSKEIVVEKLAYAQSYAQLFPRDFVLAGLIDQTNPYKTRILIALRKLDTASLDSLEKLEAEIAKQGAVFETRKERLSKIYARR